MLRILRTNLQCLGVEFHAKLYACRVDKGTFLALERHRHRVEVARLDTCLFLYRLTKTPINRGALTLTMGITMEIHYTRDCEKTAVGRIEIPLSASQRTDRPGASFQTGMMIGQRREGEAGRRRSLRRDSNGIPDQLTERRAEVNADMKRDDGVTKPE